MVVASKPMNDAKLKSRAIATEPEMKLVQVNGVAVSRAAAALAALDQDRDVEDEHDEELQGDQHREHLHRQVDLPVPAAPR